MLARLDKARVLARQTTFVAGSLGAHGRPLPWPKELPLLLRLNTAIHQHDAVVVADLAFSPDTIRAELEH